jgi:hypothetical protein
VKYDTKTAFTRPEYFCLSLTATENRIEKLIYITGNNKNNGTSGSGALIMPQPTHTH